MKKIIYLLLDADYEPFYGYEDKEKALKEGEEVGATAIREVTIQLED